MLSMTTSDSGRSLRSGAVVAIGQIDHLEVWNQEVRDAHVEYPTDEDWELLTGRNLLVGDSDLLLLRRAQLSEFSPPSRYAPDVTPELDRVVMRALARDLVLSAACAAFGAPVAARS